jgi:hypothetical protein
LNLSWIAWKNNVSLNTSHKPCTFLISPYRYTRFIKVCWTNGNYPCNSQRTMQINKDIYDSSIVGWRSVLHDLFLSQHSLNTKARTIYSRQFQQMYFFLSQHSLNTTLKHAQFIQDNFNKCISFYHNIVWTLKHAQFIQNNFNKCVLFNEWIAWSSGQIHKILSFMSTKSWASHTIAAQSWIWTK